MAKKTTPWKKPAPARTRHTHLTEGQKGEAKQRARRAGRPYPNLVDNMTVAKEKSGGGKRKAAKSSSTSGGARKAAKRRKTSSGRKAAKSRKASSGRKAAKSRTSTGRKAAKSRKASSGRKAAKSRKASSGRKSASKRTARSTRGRKGARRAGKKASSGRKAGRTTGARKAIRGASKRSPATVARRGTRDPRGGLTAQGRAAFARRDGSQLRPGVRKSDAQLTADDMRRKGSWAVRFYGRKQLPPLTDAQGRPTRFALSAHAWGEPVPKTVAQARRIAAKGRRLLERYQAQARH